jgi:hypothetical protein
MAAEKHRQNSSRPSTEGTLGRGQTKNEPKDLDIMTSPYLLTCAPGRLLHTHCGTIYQYQTPFYDGVSCNLEFFSNFSHLPQQAGVQAPAFIIVNDESY